MGIFSAPVFKSAAGYRAANSLIFNNDDSAYLSRTPPASNRNTWTWSGWVKRSELASNDMNLFAAGTTNDFTRFCFTNVGEFRYLHADGAGITDHLISSALYRDVSAPYHVIVAVDTTDAVESSRVKIYINGLRVTNFSTENYPLQNVNTDVNSAQKHRVGANSSDLNFFDGYMSEIHFIDGQALTPDDFGAFDSVTGQWLPIAYVGTYGTNGFYLDFEDNSTATTLGYDVSGNANHWTPSGITTTDQTTDTPTNNYCTLNPLDKALTNATLSDGNTNINVTAANYYGVRGTIKIPATGKWYFEFTPSNIDFTRAGICTAALNLSATAPHTSAESCVYGDADTSVHIESVAKASYWPVNPAANTVGVCVDMDAGTISWQNTTDGRGTEYAFSSTKEWFVLASAWTGGTTLNAGQKGFVLTPPTGFLALCTDNLPTPTDLVDAMYQGVIATEANIAADLAAARSGWTDYVDILKNRDAVETWAWRFSHDSSNEYAVSTTAAYQATRALAGTNNWVGHSIRIGSAYGTAAGSVAHTNGVTTTVTHNLGESRVAILLFPRSNGAVYFYHPDLTAGKLLILTSSAAEAALTQITNVTANAFDIGSGHTTGAYDYLVLSESAVVRLFDSTGNGSTDGAFINCGVLPEFDIWKRTDAAGANWQCFDTVRNSYNVASNYTVINDAAIELIYPFIDIVSNGHKHRHTSQHSNISGGTYIGIAIGQPFKYANAR